jgi:hypothetical protein
VRPERLGQLKKPTSSGTRTGDLSACSIVHQPTTLPRAPSLALLSHMKINFQAIPISVMLLFTILLLSNFVRYYDHGYNSLSLNIAAKTVETNSTIILHLNTFSSHQEVLPLWSSGQSS